MTEERERERDTGNGQKNKSNQINIFGNGKAEISFSV